jgi:outer membrane protein assembly factor BamA
LSQSRYNRVEGFSTGISVEQQLGGGYVASALGRYGFADHHFGGEVSLARTNLRQTIALTGYNRLRSANDWGDPLSFRSSVPALLFGRDEGFYFRTTGAELTWNTTSGPDLDWRLFAERQTTARQRTNFSVGGSFAPNIRADEGTSAGAGVRYAHLFGDDPRGLRAYTDVRLEAAGGDSTYGRGAMDVTFSHPIVGDLVGGLTLGGGTSVGAVPMQRRWFLGGTQTIRGQSPDTTQSGNAFWFTRAEIGKDYRTHRISLFGDLGWVGDRTKASEVGRPMSGVGLGFSMLDGAVRMDFARGLFPRKQFRVDLTLGARF